MTGRSVVVRFRALKSITCLSRVTNRADHEDSAYFDAMAC